MQESNFVHKTLYHSPTEKHEVLRYIANFAV